MSSSALKDQGNEAYKLGDHAKAVELYSQAIAATSAGEEEGLHLLYSNRAAALLALERFEDALVDCDKVLELQPKFMKAYLRKSMALRALGRKREALQVAKLGLALDASNTSTAGMPELTKLSKQIEKELVTAKARFTAKSPKEAQEMMQDYNNKHQEIERLRFEMDARQRQFRVDKLTLDYLTQVIQAVEPEQDLPQTFVSVGRMFVQTPITEVEASLGVGLGKLTSEFDSLKDKMVVLEQKFSSLSRELEEIMG
ncbi:hypothetical protein BASA81_000530 [Batrachochytrium salamandrivorans]|nr:hypothetical protein BASA81_000530 [Batrachochytrium salamandrivorans]